MEESDAVLSLVIVILGDNFADLTFGDLQYNSQPIELNHDHKDVVQLHRLLEVPINSNLPPNHQGPKLGQISGGEAVGAIATAPQTALRTMPCPPAIRVGRA